MSKIDVPKRSRRDTSSRLLALTLAVLLAFATIDIVTFTWGHELSWFGTLSPRALAVIRYGLSLLAAVLIVVAALRKYRDRDG